MDDKEQPTDENRTVSSLSLKNYALEFLSIFIAVIAAFALNNWNDNRRDNYAENKILIEVLNGLNKDLEDFENNQKGHKTGLKSATFFRNIIDSQARIEKDTFLYKYHLLLRDFFSVQNVSGYETLKSKGLELISNDTLRSQIISIYEFDYSVLSAFGGEIQEAQFYDNYYEFFNKTLAPGYRFDNENVFEYFQAPIEMSPTDRGIYLMNLHKIELNRNVISYYYSQTQERVKKLIKNIEQELE